MPNRYSSHIIVAACFMIQAVGVGTFVTYGVFLTPWQQNSIGHGRQFQEHHRWHFFFC